MGGTFGRGRLSRQLLPDDLFPQIRAGGDGGLRKISRGDGGGGRGLSKIAQGVPGDDRDGDAGPRCVRTRGAATGRRSGFWLGPIQNVRTGYYFARERPDLGFALPCDRDFDAGGNFIRGRDHGRTYSQPDARARPRASADEGGRGGFGR